MGSLTLPARAMSLWARASMGPVLVLGLAAFAIPTMVDVARESWSTEQGAHGPIVLLTGIWLVTRELRNGEPIAGGRSPGAILWLLALLVPIFTLARITGIIEIEAFSMYASLVVVICALWGGALLRRIWFPLVYMMFVFPPPDTLFAMITQPLKIGISEYAVWFLHIAGYPVAGSGVTIQIGQYQMLVAAACAGLNSLLSLTALGLFYTYIRHSSNWRYMIILLIGIVPIAIAANLIRVLLLLLITYYFGEAAGQGFFHEVAGLTMFSSALLGIFVLDWLGTPLRERLAQRSSAS